MTENTQGVGARPSSPFARSATQQQTEQTLFRSASSASNAPTSPASAPTKGSGSGDRAGRGAGVRGTGSMGAKTSGGHGPATAVGSAGAAASVPGTSGKLAPGSVGDVAKTGSAAKTTATSTTSKSAVAAPAKRTRKARLRLARIDPWSVMKTAFLFSIAFGILSTVAVWVLWGVVESSGAFASINRAVNDLLATPNSTNTFDLGRYVTGERIVGFTALIAAADVVIFTALATLFSFLYNLSATVLGGLEVTLAED